MKKVLKVLFAILAIFGFTQAFAEENPTLTINDALCREDVSYKIYRMFLINTQDRYIADYDWLDFFRTGAGKDYITIDELGYIESINETADLESIAAAALEYIKDKGKTPTYSSVEAGDCYGRTYELHAEPGYYLIESPKGKMSIIADVNPTIEINEKNIYPDVKSLFETSNGLNKNISVELGKEVNFVIEATLSKGINDRLYIEDIPDTGIYIDLDTITVTGCESTDYEIKTEDLLDDKALFGIDFKSDFLKSIDDDTTKVLIKFKGKLTKTADLNQGSFGNPNFVEYYYTSNNEVPAGSIGRIYTWHFTIQTLTGEKGNTKGVPNVHYTISKNFDGSNPMKLVKLSEGQYRIATTEDTETTTDIVNTTYDGDQVIIYGLGEESYFISQTEVPLGFVRYTPITTINIYAEEDSWDGTLRVNVKSKEFYIQYEKFTLPSTGSRSQLIMITFGCLLLTLSLCSIIYKLRIKNN